VVTSGGEVFTCGHDSRILALAGNKVITNPFRVTRSTEIIFSGPLVVNAMNNAETRDALYLNSMKVLDGESVILKTNGTKWSIRSSAGRPMSGYVDKATKGFGLVNGQNHISVTCDYDRCVINALSGIPMLPYIGNVNDQNSDFGKLYFTQTFSTPNYTIDVYKDAGKTVLVGTTGTFTTTGPKEITESGGSGLIGYLYVTSLSGTTINDTGYIKYGLINIKFKKETMDLVK
jgi:hypothetical protein